MRSTWTIGLVVGVWAVNGCVFVVNPEGDDGVSAHWAADYDTDDGEYTVGQDSSSESASLARRVGQALEQDPELANSKIQVTVSNADVTLHGEVGSIAEFENAMTITLAVDGVEEVISRMTVRVERKQVASALDTSE